MKKSDLKYGNVVETRSGDKYLFTFHDEEDIFVDLTGDGYYYFESLYFNTNYKNSDIVIMKVYKDYTCKELLWERNEKEKQKPELTEDEKVILKNFPKHYEWIARDINGHLYIYASKPKKGLTIWVGTGLPMVSFDHLFRFIKYEDKEPYSIEKLLKGVVK